MSISSEQQKMSVSEQQNWKKIQINSERGKKERRKNKAKKEERGKKGGGWGCKKERRKNSR